MPTFLLIQRIRTRQNHRKNCQLTGKKCIYEYFGVRKTVKAVTLTIDIHCSLRCKKHLCHSIHISLEQTDGMAMMYVRSDGQSDGKSECQNPKSQKAIG